MSSRCITTSDVSSQGRSLRAAANLADWAAPWLLSAIMALHDRALVESAPQRARHRHVGGRAADRVLADVWRRGVFTARRPARYRCRVDAHPPAWLALGVSAFVCRRVSPRTRTCSDLDAGGPGGHAGNAPGPGQA